MPGGLQQLVPQHVQPGLQGLDHLQRGRDLQLPDRGQMRGSGRAQRSQILPGAQRAVTRRGRALVEEHRVDARHPGGVLGPQVVVGLQQRPALQMRDGGIGTRAAGPRPAAA